MHAGPMPLGFRGHCPDCGHVWDGMVWTFACGTTSYPWIDLRLIWTLFRATQETPPAPPPRGRARSLAMAVAGCGRFCREACKAGTFFHHPKTYLSYFCARCVLQVRVPRHLSRRYWIAWVTQNATEISRSPLLLEICERLARILAGARSPRVPVPIELGAVVCPNCGDSMAIGDIDTNPLVCPQCQSRSARRDLGSPFEIILADYGPPDGAEVRRLIVHLNRLADDTQAPRG
jgi:hypothetical protein